MSFLREVASSLSHIVWPSSCPVCGRLSVKVCPECLMSLAGHFSKFCVSCGGDDPCGRHPGGTACFAVSAYEGANRDLVRAMKYASHKSVAGMMGNVIARLLPRPGADFLVPVPLHKNSEREYNQTELIALGISEVWGMPVRDCLVWRIDRGRQASSDREDRELPQGAMEAVGDVRQGKSLLVDDICTTGNTIMAAERALRSAGAVVAGAVVWGRRL